MEPTKCIKCEGELELGTIASPGSTTTIQWGTNHSTLLASFVKGRKVRAYRCKECGYIEFYSK